MCQPGILKIITKIIFWWPIYHKLVSLIWTSLFFFPITQAWGYIQLHILKTIRKYCSHFLPFYGFHFFFSKGKWESHCLIHEILILKLRLHLYNTYVIKYTSFFFPLQYLDFYFILRIYCFYNQKLYFCQIDQRFTCYAFAEVLTQSPTKLVVS